MTCHHLCVPLFPETTGLVINSQNPFKEPTVLKENHVAEQYEHSQNGGQKSSSGFLLIIKSMVGDLHVHFVPGVVSSVGTFSTHQNVHTRLLLVSEFWGLNRV